MRLIIRILIIAIVCATSLIVTSDMVTMIVLFTTLAFLKFLIGTTVYIAFQLIKWSVIIVLIGVLLAIIL